MTNFELLKYAKLLKIPNFRGVYMKDELKNLKSRKNERAIINLDSSRGAGTHWVAYKKETKRGVGDAVYFDSFGLRPPKEVVEYLKGSRIVYSNDRIQNMNDSNCGRLCLEFLIS